MSEKSFAFASVSVAIVLGVFFYPPPARDAQQEVRSKQAAPTVGQLQQAHAGALESRGRHGEIGVD